LSGPHDVFISHDHVSAAQVKRLTSALASIGVSSCAEEGDQSPGLQPKLATSKIFLGWGSEGFFNSRSCQTHLAMAYVAQNNAAGTSTNRILMINPEIGLKHIYPLPLREHIIANASGSLNTDDFLEIAQRIKSVTQELCGNIGDLYPIKQDGWLEPYDQLTRAPAHFIGRERELWDIHYGLHPTGRLYGPCPTLVVSAASGHGKTSLVREYVFRFAGAYPSGVYKISARNAKPVSSLSDLDQNPALKSQLLHLYRNLQPDVSAPHDCTLAWLISKVSSFFESRAEPFLWIVDEIPEGINGPALSQWLAPDNTGKLGRTLLVSRSQRYDQRAEPIHIPALSEEAGTFLVTRGKIHSRSDDLETIGWLMEELGRHPRFIVMAGALAGEKFQNKRSAFTSILQKLEKRSKSTNELAKAISDELPSGQEHQATALLLEALNALKSPARNLLLLANQLDDHEAPIEFITNCFLLSGLSLEDRKEDLFTIFLNEPKEEPMAPEEASAHIEKAADSLISFALAERTDGSIKFYPAAVKAVAKFFPAEEKQNTLREAALQALYLIAENCAATDNWSDLAEVAPHGHKLLEDIRERQIHPEDTAAEITGRIRLAFYLADMDLNHGDIDRAIKLYRSASAYLVRSMALDPHNNSRQRDFAKVQEQLGTLAQLGGDLSAALDHYRKSLGVRSFLSKQVSNGVEPLQDHLRLHTKIGKILVDLHDIEGALQSFRAAHGICLKLAQELPEDSQLQFELASSYERLASLYIRLNDTEHAMTALNHALPVFTSLSEKFPELPSYVRSPGSVHNLIGDLLKSRDDLSGALSRYEKGLAIAEMASKLEPHDANASRNMAVCHNNIGDTLSGLDDSSAAKTHFIRFLEIAQNPENQPAFSGIKRRDIGVVEIKLGLLSESSKEIDHAIERYQKARGIIERLAIDFPDNDTLREDLAWLRKKTDRLIERRDADLRRLQRERQQSQAN